MDHPQLISLFLRVADGAFFTFIATKFGTEYQAHKVAPKKMADIF